MRMPTTTRRSQPMGFTLIELLVVIAIIAVLISLTAAAVMKVMGSGPRVQTRVEIGDMEASLRAMMTDFHDLNYVPSKIVLHKFMKNYTLPAEEESVRVLTKMFGKGIFNNPNQQINWDGDMNPWPNDTQVLEGQHCLVFFLGGIPTASGQPPGCLGFSKNPQNPAAQEGAGVARYGPYFEFKSSRLVRTKGNFMVYNDPYGKKPYAFFSYHGAGNDYNDNDCLSLQTLPTPVKPYSTGTGNQLRYINGKGVQIISAGEDGVFGPGGPWNPAVGYNGSGPGRDDLANFSQRQLGYGTD